MTLGPPMPGADVGEGGDDCLCRCRESDNGASGETVARSRKVCSSAHFARDVRIRLSSGVGASASRSRGGFGDDNRAEGRPRWLLEHCLSKAAILFGKGLLDAFASFAVALRTILKEKRALEHAADY